MQKRPNKTKLEQKQPKEDKITISEVNQIISDFDSATGGQWLDMAQKSWSEYIGGETKGPGSRSGRDKRYPLWYATQRVRQPLIFSRVPDVVCNPLVDDEQGLTSMAAVFAEKLGHILLEIFPFYRTACAARDDLLMTSLGVARILYDAEFVEEPKKEPVTIEEQEVTDPETGQVGIMEVFVDASGEPVDPGLVMYDFQNQPYIESDSVEEKVKKESCCLKPVAYDEFIWDFEARDFSEWRYCGFRSWMTKREIIHRYGYEASTTITKDDDEEVAATKKHEVVEFWYKPTKTRHIFINGGSDFMAVDNDPYGLKDFFPLVCPMFDNLTSRNSIPITEYQEVVPILDNVHDVYNRQSECVRLARPRALFDSSIPELSKLISKAKSGDYIGVPNLAAKAKEGQTMVLYLDTGSISATLQQLGTEFDRQFAAYDQVTGFSDIVRGITNPYETATSTERKAQFAMHRLKSLQQDMQRWCRDNLRLMLDMALSKFTDERIYELLEPSFDEEERDAFFEVLKKLRSDNWRSISLDIETQSTIMIDDEVRQGQAVEFANAVLGYMQQLAAVSQQNPEFVPVFSEVIEDVIETFNSGKAVNGELEKAFDNLIAANEARVAQAQQLPPDPKMLDAQTRAQRLQLDAQKSGRELQLKEAAEAHRQRMDQAKLNLETLAEQLDARLAREELSLEERELAVSEYIEQARLEMDQVMESLNIQEKFMEEKRLAEKQLQGPEVVAMQPIVQPAPEPQVVPIPVPVRGI